MSVEQQRVIARRVAPNMLMLRQNSGDANQLVKGFVRVIAPAAVPAEKKVLAKWQELLGQYRDKTLFYQSPQYFDHLAALRSDCAYLAVLEDKNGTPFGVVPVQKAAVSLKFEIRDYRFAAIPFSGIRILGGTLLTAQSVDVLELLFREIAARFPECDAFEIKGMPTSGLLWQTLQRSHYLKRNFTIYAPDGPRKCQTTMVAASFAEHLSGFGRKKSYNLRRQIKRLEEFAAGTMVLQRVDRESHVDALQNAWKALAGNASREGDLTTSEMFDLAQRGLMLGYVLTVNGKPCSLALGTRFQETLMLHAFQHDHAISRLSPGTVLQTLMMKDLIEQTDIRRIDYGFGEPQYRMTNDTEERITAIIVRKSFRSRSLIALHRAYVRLLNAAKRRMDP
ncbi:MAG TPA: GNAT family N-acetyltransferase [Micropepsaceae bacterium]|jgi:CelD/BcsL family acetyltransferase involved in cellulose biosynthesis|nr:GNAT family N-acetyltransferase [Micropepsaceae bacterium]